MTKKMQERLLEEIRKAPIEDDDNNENMDFILIAGGDMCYNGSVKGLTQMLGTVMYEIGQMRNVPPDIVLMLSEEWMRRLGRRGSKLSDWLKNIIAKDEKTNKET